MVPFGTDETDGISLVVVEVDDGAILLRQRLDGPQQIAVLRRSGRGGRRCRIVREYSPMLLRLACTRLDSTADAEDAVQEVFLQPPENPDHMEGRQLPFYNRSSSFDLLLQQLPQPVPARIPPPTRRTRCRRRFCSCCPLPSRSGTPDTRRRG